MQISTVKYYHTQDKDLNIGVDTKKHVEPRLKDSQKNSNEMLKKITTDNSDVKVTLRSKRDSGVYTKPEIKDAQVTQGLDVADKKVIENTPSDGPSVGEIAEEVGISLIPIYGTIHEFQKGNIGWGIFGAITDALILIPVVGATAKAVGAAIRGGTTAVRAARVGLTAAEVTSKITTTTVAKQFTVGASEGLAKSGKDLGKAVLRAVDPGIELLYGGGEFVGKQTAKMARSITSTTAKSGDVLNIFKWKDITSFAPASDTTNKLQDIFHEIKSTPNLKRQFDVDFPRDTYKIDDKVIPRGNLDEFKKAVPDLVEMDRKPRVLNHNGVSISQTGHAKQLVIMTHGGWKEIERNTTMFRHQVGDGWTSVPHGTRIDFYAEDQNFTKGLSVLSEVHKRPHDALNGLEPFIDLSDSDIELLAKSRNMPASNLKDEMMKLATYRKESTSNGNVVKNYALYHHEQTDSLIEKHQSEFDNKEVDIAFVTDKKHKKHLSDVFEAIKKTGVEYEVIHFGACRVDRGGHAIPT